MIGKIRGVRGTVAGIIYRNSRVFLERRSRKIIIGGNKWCLPGGHINFGETAEQAIKREIKEETGLNVKKTTFLFYIDEIISRLSLHNIVLVFKTSVSGKLKTNWEVSETGWFTLKEIENLNMAFDHKRIIKRFFKTGKS